LVTEEASAVAENRPKRRIEKLKGSGPLKVGDSDIDWYRDRRRPAIANKLLWLRFDDSDRPVKAAFDYLELNHSNPYHWRILIDCLAMALFPEVKKGPRPKTTSKNTKLLARCDALPKKFKTNPTTMLKELMRVHYKDYNPKRSSQTSTAYKSQLRNLRRRLNAARDEFEESKYHELKELERKIADGYVPEGTK
jgi:hypothetical protein